MSLFSTCYQGRLNSCITRRSSCRAPASQVIFRAGVYNPVISLPSPQVLCSPSLAGIETLPVLFSIPPPPLPNKHSFSVSAFYQASSLQCPGDLLAVPPCSEPCPLPPPPAFRVLCDCFLPSILIFTHLPWSPDQPFSSHQAAGLSFCLSSGVFCLPFTFSPCALPVHTLFQFLAVFSPASPSLCPFLLFQSVPHHLADIFISECWKVSGEGGSFPRTAVDSRISFPAPGCVCVLAEVVPPVDKFSGCVDTYIDMNVR